MLRDMSKKSSSKLSEKGRKKLLQRLEKNGWEDAPTRESIQPRVSYGWKEGGGISCSPLYRYLKNSVGRKWEQVCRRIPREYANQLGWRVRTDVQSKNGLYWSVNGWDGCFFVEDGILKMIPRRNRWRRKKDGVVKPVYRDVYEPARGWVGRAVIEEQVEYGGKLYILRAGQWYRKDYVGERDVMRWFEDHYVKVGTEPVFKDFQISRREKRKLLSYISGQTSNS